METEQEHFETQLARFFQGDAGEAGAAAVVGIGNTDRGDDGFGPAVVASLSETGTSGLLLIDAGIRPESCLDVLEGAKARRVLFVDAAGDEAAGGDGDGEGEANGGRWRCAPLLQLINPSALVGTSVSTHRLHLGLVAELLREQTGAEVKVLIFRVSGDGRLERFAPLSGGARAAAGRAAAAIRDAMRGRNR